MRKKDNIARRGSKEKRDFGVVTELGEGEVHEQDVNSCQMGEGAAPLPHQDAEGG